MKPTLEHWSRIADLARFAPTPHNTQPFRILARDANSADVILLRDRLLPREDHGNLYMASAFGVLAVAMRFAARQLGLELDVSPDVTIDPATLHTSGERVTIGTATITGSCAAAPSSDLLTVRRTSRIPYNDLVVDSSAIHAFDKVVGDRGHRFLQYDDAAVVDRILRLNANAIVDNLHFDEEREEISSWYRTGTTPTFGDGLWEKPMNQPAWEIRTAFNFPHLFHLPLFRQFAVHRYLRTQRGTRHIGLLCGPFRRPGELFSAGETLMNLWLEMARVGVYMQPMGSMLTNPHYASKIARTFGADDCWLVFRFGYGGPPPQAPRLQSILVNE
ncbi:MAG: hypothetical protein ABI311_03195 [Gemmatimonadaceae bacterium]